MKGLTLVEIVAIAIIIAVIAMAVIEFLQCNENKFVNEYSVEIVKNSYTIRRYKANSYKVEGDRIVIEID